ncbi:MAG: preprotein translocase subunit SecY [Bernardetiaceae bacterium]
MKRFFETIRHIFAIEELKQRILITLGLLVIFRLGSYIVLPGIDPVVLKQASGSSPLDGLFNMIDLILGGAFNRASLFALGIMPYISASIVIQLATVASPYFQKLQKEGESGRKKITQITRVLTIIVTLGQSFAYVNGTIPKEAVMIDFFFFTISSMIILTSGTIFCMWLGEKITDRGIGNGISMLIMIGIIAVFPGAILQEITAKTENDGLIIFVLEAIALFFVVMATVLLVQAIRRVHVQYAKQVVGESRRQRVGGGQRSYIPLKVNASGVMPIIFAQALMFAPPLIASVFADKSDVAQYIQVAFSNFRSWEYNLTFAILIILFTFFYTAITVDPKRIAEDMKRGGGFIPGYRPGEETAERIAWIIDRITLPGAIFLAIVAILPAFASLAGVGDAFAQFYGGTSLLIMVGVIIDTLQQINSYLLMQEYEGLMKSGKMTDFASV